MLRPPPLIALFFACVSTTLGWNLVRQNHREHHYYAIHSAAPSEIARLLDLTHHGQIGELENYHLFSCPKTGEHEDPVGQQVEQLQKLQFGGQLEKRALSALASISSLEKQIPRLRSKRGPIPPPPPPNGATSGNITSSNNSPLEDPMFQKQWFLHNGAKRDINVTGVWEQGITGKGVVVAILDDGLDMDNKDLASNYFAEGSFDFNDHVSQPKPRLSDDYHGTRCAGEIAAAKNDFCGIGVAYEAKVAGLRILSAEITDTDEALAINYQYQKNQVYSCSWGPPDDGQSMDGPKGLILYALINGIQKGRGGKGSVFVFASGNGGSHDDNCNFDGYTNSIYTVTIGAIDHTDAHPYYSESCAAQLAVSYSSGQGNYIYTTDVGHSSCSNLHGGTSAAAPLAAGIIALVLSIRPELHWRDIQHLCVQAAIPISLEDEDWKPTAAGRLFNHKFGYGKLDAYRIVEAAKTFQSVGPQIRLETPVQVVGKKIPQGEHGVNSTIQITEAETGPAQLHSLEHVTVRVNIDHARRGDLEVYLISPNQIVSQLAARRRLDESKAGMKSWTFMSVKHWDESPLGNWTLQVIDRVNPDAGGDFLDWAIVMFGVESNPNLKDQATTAKGLTAEVAATPPTDANWYLALAIFAVIGVVGVGCLIVKRSQERGWYREVTADDSTDEPHPTNESTDRLLESSPSG
ncbi:hypothetical protein K493DRAFT_229099 [Basidiobolus meristosporus CBS 931.73]|uniref:P/Homo B domain-containing protein n=1 Tax=Basidiobolus meristosporus CBS 931.73 TaxID=1314790 RepID=A0A1Y1XZ42_9FUNG|nr:hypothetical protein K493DRAFT_229099 [Basidiobolus meristosporus CBS 931.73]|eukprot:ORX91020.1 hypothetical protein K493DRAFT_229099 [Basidiobolus meristosporus CBS 931.73]